MLYIVTKAFLSLSMVLTWVCKATLGDTFVSCFALSSPKISNICKPDLCEEGSDRGLISSAGELSVIRVSLKKKKWNFCGLKNFHLSN